MLNFQYCERCGEHENEIDETLYTCKCMKGKPYDIDRALSQIEEFLRENDFRDYDRNSMASMAGKNHNS